MAPQELEMAPQELEPPPSIETLGSELLPIVCRTSHYEGLELFDMLHLRATSKQLCRDVMAAIRDHYTTIWQPGEDSAEADSALARSRMGHVPSTHLMRAIREVNSAVARTPQWAATGHGSDSDDRIAWCVDDNDARLCPGLGAMIMRMIEHSGGTPRDLHFRSFKPIGVEHPCGKLSVESHGMGAGGVPTVTLCFIKACTSVATWSFYVGKHSWLLLQVGCNPVAEGLHPSLRRWSIGQRLCNLQDHLDDTPLRAEQGFGTESTSDSAARREFLVQVHDFWREAQTYFLPADRCIGDDLMDLRPQLLPRCAACSAMCHKRLSCGRCKCTTYCSSACQRSDWTRHKPTCVPPEQRKQEDERATARALRRLQELSDDPW